MKRKRKRRVTLMDRAIEAENRLTMARHGNWMQNCYSNGFYDGYRACQADARRKAKARRK